jgi:thiamine-monophosphate kinase
MDISDGLSLDLQRLCLASRMNAEIGDPPAFPGATIEQALHGGEEYELLFTVRAGTRVPAAFEGLALTRIGVIRKPDRITNNRAGEVRHNGKLLPALGYDHFKHK